MTHRSMSFVLGAEAPHAFLLGCSWNMLFTRLLLGASLDAGRRAGWRGRDSRHCVLRDAANITSSVTQQACLLCDAADILLSHTADIGCCAT